MPKTFLSMLQLHSSEIQQGLKDNLFNCIPEDPVGPGEGVALIGCDDDRACANGTKCNVVSVGIFLNRQGEFGDWLG